MPINPLLAVVVMFVVGCATPGSEPQPAHIVEPSSASRAALQKTVSRALGVEVMLDDKALTESSILVLERQARRNQSRLQGRERSEPERFYLLRHADDCLLEHERTGRRYPLSAVRCETE